MRTFSFFYANLFMPMAVISYTRTCSNYFLKKKRKIVKTLKKHKRTTGKAEHNKSQLPAQLRTFRTEPFEMNKRLIRCCARSFLCQSCLPRFIYVFIFMKWGEHTFFLAHFTVDELSDQLHQHGVLRPPGEN